MLITNSKFTESIIGFGIFIAAAIAIVRPIASSGTHMLLRMLIVDAASPKPANLPNDRPTNQPTNRPINTTLRLI